MKQFLGNLLRIRIFVTTCEKFNILKFLLGEKRNLFYVKIIQIRNYEHYLKAIVEKSDWKENHCLQESFNRALSSSSQDGKSSASVVEDLRNEGVIILPLIVLFLFAFFGELKPDLSYILR